MVIRSSYEVTVDYGQGWGVGSKLLLKTDFINSHFLQTGVICHQDWTNCIRQGIFQQRITRNALRLRPIKTCLISFISPDNHF